MTADALLEVSDLRTYFTSGGRFTKAVDGITYSLRAGETLAVVGESGSGKSAHARSLIRLLPGAGRIVGGRIRFDGDDLLTLSEREMREVRGRKIGMIFQEPMSSLNPLVPIGTQITESLRVHLGMSRREAKQRALELLAKVRLPDPPRHLEEYPHQLSGGMCQRVMLAIAVACSPSLLIADEPTTALDVTVQAQILELIGDLSGELGMAVILITHDLGIVAQYADRVMVMYAGKIVEQSSVSELFEHPAHPYSADLLGSLPRIDPGRGPRPLTSIPGSPPDLSDLPSGCAYAPRCRLAIERCRHETPPVVVTGPNRVATCWLADGEPADAPMQEVR